MARTAAASHGGVSARWSGPHANTVGPSSYLAGHSVTPADGLSSASATFKMPTVDCSNDNDLRGQIFGLIDEPTLGDTESYASVWAYCSSGALTTVMTTQAANDFHQGVSVSPG
ncbi:MAG: hypothetical protein JO214_17525 [Frankiaceae bacterium]|nr:hypothetical protein [Frankiaceae bacterium]